MTKQLFEEALADVKKVKQVAEENALRALTEAVTPRIREFIDRAILQEDVGDDVDPLAAPGVDPEAPVLADVAPDGSAGAITLPDAEGKVTLDIDAMCSGEMGGTAPGPAVPAPMFGEPAPKPDDEEYEISLESVEALKPVLAASEKKVAEAVSRVAKQAKLLKEAGAAVKATPSYRNQIAQMISRVEDMYDYVQERVADPAAKSSYETSLEATFKALNQLQESMTMSQKMKKSQVNEADLTLKLTGLPDDVEDNLDAVGVDLITGEEGEGEGDEGAGDEGGEGAGLDDLGLGGDQGSEGEDTQMESRKLSDDTIVEIDENMLRREIARMRSLREETKPASWGDGPGGANILDDFGGGKDEGDAVDQDIAHLSPAKAARPLGEADEDLDEVQADMDEADQMDEQDEDDLDELAQGYGMDQAVHAPQDMAMTEDDELDQIGDRRSRDDFGGSSTSVPSVDRDNPAQRHHEAKRRLGFEKKLQERAKARAAALKKEAAKARAAKNGKRLAEVKKEYALVAKRFNESLARSKKMSKLLKLHEARLNSAAARPAENQAAQTLRKKLAETNLFNAKLLFTNKLLQTESLTARQKAQVIKQLDEAKTVREAKLVYESLTKTLATTQKASLREGTDRTVLGSASRATRPASTQTLTEGYETERWAQLAGITKR
jgi:hypothetical protein